MGTEDLAVRTGWCGRCGSWPDSKVAVLSGGPVRSGQRQEYFRSCPPLPSPTTSAGCSTSAPRRARSATGPARTHCAIGSRRSGGRCRTRDGDSTARPILVRAPETADPIEGPASVAASVQVVAEDHSADLGRFLRGLAAHPPSTTWELVVVANAPDEPVADALASVALPVEPVVLPTAEPPRLGRLADARPAPQRRRGDDPARHLRRADRRLRDPAARGLRRSSGRDRGRLGRHERRRARVRRGAARAGRRDRGLLPRRSAARRCARSAASIAASGSTATPTWTSRSPSGMPAGRRCGPIRCRCDCHEHRGWTALPDAERDRLSKRNFYRFLDRWGDRPDLLLHPDPDR